MNLEQRASNERTAAKVEAKIEAVAMEQLRAYDDELTASQIKIIAHQIAREATRRLGPFGGHRGHNQEDLDHD